MDAHHGMQVRNRRCQKILERLQWTLFPMKKGLFIPMISGHFHPFLTPILLGSLWALVPGIKAVVCIIFATSSEDRILQTELPDYQDYAQKVRFRLVPAFGEVHFAAA